MATDDDKQGHPLPADETAQDLKLLGTVRRWFGNGWGWPAKFLKAVTIALGTITTNGPPLAITQTWNAAGVTFQTILATVTDTASAAASTLIDLKVGAASMFKVDKAGNTTVAGTLGVTGATTLATTLTGYLKGASGVVSAQAVPVPVADGGSGQTSYTNGQLLIGNTTGNTLAKGTLTAGNMIGVTNGAAAITLALSGGSAFPGSPASGDAFYRTDKKCWYGYDGTKWNIVGVEQTIATTAAPVQTINSTTAADITSSSITVTTTGAGAISVHGFVRCNTVSGTLVVQCLINGTAIAVDPTQSNTVDATIAIAHRVAVSAAGAYTVKLQGKMAGAATSATVTSFGFVTMATAA